MTDCLSVSGAALAIILAIAVAIGMIIFLFGLLYIRRFGATSFLTFRHSLKFSSAIISSIVFFYNSVGINSALATIQFT